MILPRPTLQLCLPVKDPNTQLALDAIVDFINNPPGGAGEEGQGPSDVWVVQHPERPEDEQLYSDEDFVVDVPAHAIFHYDEDEEKTPDEQFTQLGHVFMVVTDTSGDDFECRAADPTDLTLTWGPTWLCKDPSEMSPAVDDPVLVGWQRTPDPGNVYAYISGGGRALATEDPETVGATGEDVGEEVDVARSDHKHQLDSALFSSVTPTDVDADGEAAGTATTLSRSDHKHELGSGAGGGLPSSSGKSKYMVLQLDADDGDAVWDWVRAS